MATAIKYIVVGLLVLPLCQSQEVKVLDLGSLAQYETDIDAKELSGNAIWMSGKESSGLNVAFSPDKQDEVQKVLGGCQKFDNDCYLSVCNVIQSSDLQLDKQIERRHFGHFISKTFKTKSLAFTAIASYLLSAWSLRHIHEPTLKFDNLVIPASQANNLGSLGDAEKIVVSAGGKEIATITPTTASVKLEGTATPIVSSVSTSAPGKKAGDLKITMRADTANRLEEIMRRSTDCAEGINFDNEANGKRAMRRKIGPAICATAQVYNQLPLGGKGPKGPGDLSVGGGPFPDLLLMKPPKFTIVAGDVAAAAGVVANVVKDYAPLLDIEGAASQALGQVVFLLAFNVLVEGVQLGAENTVSAELISDLVTQAPETMTATTSSGCAKSTACEVSCEGVGMKFDYCETTCGVVSGCRTGTGTQTSTPVTTITTKAWIPPTGLVTMTDALPTPTVNPSCAMDKPAGLQWDAFANSKHNVAKRFCEQASQDATKPLAQIVDIEGNNVDEKLRRRTPPVDPKSYRGYIVDLSYKPNQVFDSGACLKSCTDAYQTLAHRCGHTGGQGNVMAEEGQYNAECGSYSYKITDTSPKKGEVRCNKATDFPGHKDVQEYTVVNGGQRMCGSGTPDVMTPGSGSITHIYYSSALPAWTSASKLNFTVSWRKDCAPAMTEQNPKEPWARNSGGVGCRQLYKRLWEDCHNGGVGGSRDIGCLTYSLSPAMD